MISLGWGWWSGNVSYGLEEFGVREKNTITGNNRAKKGSTRTYKITFRWVEFNPNVANMGKNLAEVSKVIIKGFGKDNDVIKVGEARKHVAHEVGESSGAVTEAEGQAIAFKQTTRTSMESSLMFVRDLPVTGL